jgi:hypothetical protein
MAVHTDQGKYPCDIMHRFCLCLCRILSLTYFGCLIMGFYVRLFWFNDIPALVAKDHKDDETL